MTISNNDVDQSQNNNDAEAPNSETDGHDGVTRRSVIGGTVALTAGSLGAGVGLGSGPAEGALRESMQISVEFHQGGMASCDGANLANALQQNTRDISQILTRIVGDDLCNGTSYGEWVNENPPNGDDEARLAFGTVSRVGVTSIRPGTRGR